MIKRFAMIMAVAAAVATANADTELPLANLSLPQPNDSIECHISGTLIDRPDTKSVYIIEAGKDLRIHPSVKVPVVDGRYEYTLRDDMPRAYEVFFDDEMRRGNMRIRHFFTGNGDVEIISHAGGLEDNDSLRSDLPDNILAEGWRKIELRDFMPRLNRLYAKMDSLYDNKAALRPEVQRLDAEFASMEPGEKRDSVNDLRKAYYKGPREKCYTDEYIECERQGIEILKDLDSAQRAYIMQNPSLYGLFRVKDAISTKGRDWVDIPAYLGIFETAYADFMPNHPYKTDILGYIDAREVKVGNKYPDYMVTRPDGTKASMASLIKGSFAVIDLWASWCIPCRRHSRELIPIYEKYKDKGFKVIAVAREIQDCEAMNAAIAADGYPWESFVDIGDADKVWMINNAGNSGGKIILVDPTGTIIATDLPIPEIAAYLQTAYPD